MRFERVTGYDNAVLPTRADVGSAGYDFRVLNRARIDPGKTVIFETGIKVFIPSGFHLYLALHVRSSIGIKKECVLANSTGIIDASYYNNPDNEGHILIALRNMGSKPVIIEAGERVAQGIFTPYSYCETTEEYAELLEKKRVGGIGSTGRK